MSKPKPIEAVRKPFNHSVKPEIKSNPSNLTSKTINKSTINRNNLSNASTSSTSSRTMVVSNKTQLTNRTHGILNHHSLVSQPASKYVCQLCQLDFYDIERYNSHLINIHKIDQRINWLQCYVAGCEEKFKRRMQLVEHLNDVHDQGVVVLTKIVQDLDGKSYDAFLNKSHRFMCEHRLLTCCSSYPRRSHIARRSTTISIHQMESGDRESERLHMDTEQ